MKKEIQLVLFIMAVFILFSCTGNKTIQYSDLPKIDAHVHIQTANPDIINFAREQNFRMITLCTSSNSSEYIKKQLDFAKKQRDQFPQTLAYATTFSMERFGEPVWQEEVINKLKKDFDEGAIGVKVWKDIGMTFKDSLGNFIMIDDPRFDPVFDFIAQNNKPVVAHLGEPRNCWLPLDSMTVKSDRAYYEEHPQYHMYKHPDYPSYEDQIAARDRWLEKNPGLRVVGAHLGSLEWSVDELAKRLDKYLNFSVDMAARICHFQVQDTKKVHDFIEKYQDRLMYSTDLFITDEDNYEETMTEAKQDWENHWRYFATEDEMTSRRVNKGFKGLGLDEKVLRKIYYENTMKWYPGVFK